MMRHNTHGLSPLNQSQQSRRAVLLIALITSSMLLWSVSAQEPVEPTATETATLTATATLTPSPSATLTATVTRQEPTAAVLSVSSTEPGSVSNTQSAILSVFGANFTASTTVRLIGAGLLQTTFINTNALTAVLPAGIPSGTYAIEVSDPLNGTATSPNSISVFPPPPTPITPFPTNPPLPTFEVPTPFPTPLPATPVPGQPSLIVRNFFADPATTAPGGTVALQFEIVNVGNRAALGISVSLNAEGEFAPANGQVSATLPDLEPGGIFEVSLSVIASSTVEAGINNIPITMAFRDFSGQVYTSSAVLSVNVETVASASLVTIDSYAVSPNPVEPGSPMTLIVVVENSGTGTAERALLRIAGDGGILLAGGQGDTFPIGDLAAGERRTIEMPMIVTSDAKPGPQRQPVSLSYDQDNERADSNSSVTIYVSNPVAPLLLLDSYDTGADTLTPGDRFTLTMTMRNIADAAAPDALITFGTVVTSGGTGSGGGSGSGGSSGGSGGSSSETIPSSVFAPLGSGNTILAGDIAGNGELTIAQEFIVNGSVRSGIYNLPITVRYRQRDNTFAQESFQASIVVVVPPRLQTRLVTALPYFVDVGAIFPISLEIINNGTTAVELLRVEIAAENADLPDGDERELETLRADSDVTIDAVMQPLAEGDVTVNFTVFYRDDLNAERSYTVTYETEASEPPPQEEFTPPPDIEEEPTPTPVPEDDLVGRLLLGFLGLGG